jgi:hypothetical protein
MKAAQAEMEAREEARQEKMKADINASIGASQEKRIAELKAAILTSFRGSTTCQTESTSCPEEINDAIKIEINPEKTQDAVGSSEDRYGD